MKEVNSYVTKTAAIIAILVALIVLAGWFFNIPVLKTALSDTSSMKFNTAVCLMLSGLSLLMQDNNRINKAGKIHILCALAVLFIALLTIFEYIASRNIGIDELFWKESTQVIPDSFPGRMGMITAICFILINSCLLVLKKRKLHFFLQLTLVLVISLSMLAVFNNILKTYLLTNSIPTFYKTATHTAISFILLSIGIFYTRELQYLKFRFQKKIAAFFMLTVLALAIIFFTIKKNAAHTAETAKLVEHTNEVLLQCGAIHIDVDEMQRGVIDFVITADTIYLTRHDILAGNLIASVNKLKALIKDNPQQQSRVNSLDKHAINYIRNRNELISIRKNSGFEAAKKYMLEESKREKSIDSIQAIITLIQQGETQLLTEQKADNEESIANSSRIIFLFQIIIGLLLLAAFTIIYNNTRKRNKAEQDMLATTTRFSTIFNLSPVPISISAADDGRFIYVNDAFTKTTGYKREDIIGKTSVEINLVPREKREKSIQQIEIAGGFIENAELEIRKANGDMLDVLTSVEKIEIDNTKYFAFVMVDITDRKKAEAEVKYLNETLEKRVEEKTREVIEKEKQYRFLLENMQEGIQIIGHDWKYLFVNNSVVAQGKYSDKELLGHTMMEKYPGIENTEMFKVLEHCMKKRTSEVFENEFTFPDGNKEWFELSVQPVPEGIFILSMDITERKKAEDALTEGEKKYRTIVDTTDEMIHTLSAEGEIRWVNESWKKNMGVTDKDVIGRRLVDFLDEPTTIELGNVFLQLMKGTKVDNLFCTFITKNQSHIFIEGETLPVFSNGKVIGSQAFLRNVTERKKAEDAILKLNETLEKRASELAASNKELEQFAYVASHDLQEPLRMVSSFLQLLEKKIQGQLDETTKSYIDFAVDGADRMKKLIQDLLMFSRVGTNKEPFTKTDCNELLRTVQSFYSLSLSETGATLLVKPLPIIKGIKPLLQQVFQNLVGNALKYRGSDSPEIEVGSSERNGSWLFYVKDNGIGIDRKFFDKIFIIFQRLHNKTEHSGTGIGLAVCKKIIERHHGRIWVESEPGKGSTFYFTIPK